MQHCLGGGPHSAHASPAVAAVLAVAALLQADWEEWDDVVGKLDGRMSGIQSGSDAGDVCSLFEMNSSI